MSLVLVFVEFSSEIPKKTKKNHLCGIGIVQSLNNLHSQFFNPHEDLFLTVK